VDGNPKFDQPETEAVAQKMFKLTRKHGGHWVQRTWRPRQRRVQNDRAGYWKHDRYKEEMREAVEKALENKFKEFFMTTIAEQLQSGLLWINPS
jgi:hypothetical protein